MHCATFVRSAACWSSSAWSTDGSEGPSRRSWDSKFRLASGTASKRRLVRRTRTFGRLSQWRCGSRGRMAAIRSCWKREIKKIVSGRWKLQNSRVNEAPLHRHEIQAVNVAGELIDHLLEAAEDVHAWVDDAGRVSVAGAWQISTHRRRFPLERLRVKAEQNITNLRRKFLIFNCRHLQRYATHHLVVPAAENVNFAFVCDRRVPYNDGRFIIFGERHKKKIRSKS